MEGRQRRERESVMTDRTDRTTIEPRSEPDLAALRNAVAQSAIHVELAPPAEAVIADWAKVRHCDEVDSEILAWIVSHVRRADRQRIH
jgi:hypothetical protein